MSMAVLHRNLRDLRALLTLILCPNLVLHSSTLQMILKEKKTNQFVDSGKLQTHIFYTVLVHAQFLD